MTIRIRFTDPDGRSQSIERDGLELVTCRDQIRRAYALAPGDEILYDDGPEPVYCMITRVEHV